MNKKLTCCFVMLAFLGCKYEDGPLVSLVSPTARVAGHYTIESVTADGVDQMEFINSLHINTMSFGEENAPIGGYNFGITFTDTTTPVNSAWWWWTFSDNKSIGIYNECGINGTLADPPFAPLPALLADSTCEPGIMRWDILKLSQRKLWLKAEFNGKEYEVHLKQL